MLGTHRGQWLISVGSPCCMPGYLLGVLGLVLLAVIFRGTSEKWKLHQRLLCSWPPGLLLEGLQSMGCEGDPQHHVSPLSCDGHVEPGFLFLLSFEDLFFLMHLKHVGMLNTIASARSGGF